MSLWMPCNQIQIPILPSLQPLLLHHRKHIIEFPHWRYQCPGILKQNLDSRRIPVLLINWTPLLNHTLEYQMQMQDLTTKQQRPNSQPQWWSPQPLPSPQLWWRNAASAARVEWWLSWADCLTWAWHIAQARHVRKLRPLSRLFSEYTGHCFPSWLEGGMWKPLWRRADGVGAGSDSWYSNSTNLGEHWVVNWERVLLIGVLSFWWFCRSCESLLPWVIPAFYRARVHCILVLVVFGEFGVYKHPHPYSRNSSGYLISWWCCSSKEISGWSRARQKLFPYPRSVKRA